IEAMEKTVHAFHLIHIQNMGAVPMDIRKHFFEPGDGPHCMDSLRGMISSDQSIEKIKRHQAASANG
ncbi:MAG: hypothetical protein MUP98_03970, partial [Candidatus Aminicenantes bacterium]|nr:hypothetical protein [Candidatus Aminicenantes bacterium]